MTDQGEQHGGAFTGLRRERRAGSKANFAAIAEVERLMLFTRPLGRERATKVLAEIAALICASLPDVEIGRASRSTIEFAYSARNSNDACSALESLSRLIEQSLQIDGLPLNLVVQFGVAPLPLTGLNEDALDGADCALAEARALRRRVVYAPEMGGSGGNLSQADPLLLLREIHSGLMNGRFEMYFQPKVRVRTGKVDAAEALIRWHHQDFETISTADLIEVAETTGAIRDLTMFGVESVLEAQRQLAAAGHQLLIFLNLSATLLTDEPFIHSLADKLASAAAPLGIEVTETAILDDPERAVANLSFLRKAGIKIAIDDYGTGLSSLTYLREMPADELKIDRSFISKLTSSHRDPLIVRSTIDLAHALELDVCAEGIEDGLTLALLSAMGCDMLQGYHLGHPMPLPLFLNYLANWQGMDEKIGQLPLLRVAGQQA
jgi:diguanylate cyclase